ncbi:ABC transporter ATP-binding protein [Pararhizobium haloflavum]|uniref:ABC transporter ATP-binding protein n=1 Tax=Pararhizobium haloflavum TaxID=2037914 RepID=UPI0018E4C873|nr:ABC transporter ATP-binding protein [Pararhizobium haloflavum]
MSDAESNSDHQEPLLAAKGLVRHFPTAKGAAVAGVDFDVRDGELLALLGPSGCGKTTTLRLTGGFERPDAGTIWLAGREITRLPPEKRGIGFVFQDYALFPHLDVAHNVAFGLRGRPKGEIEAQVREMLALVGLADLGHRMPHQLSGGQQQRVALARTLALQPALVLLDEPFSNLDAAMRVETRQEVRNLLKQTGSAGILVTHDQEEALALADRIAVMDAGRILQIGTPDAVYRNPASEFVARFIGRSNILEAEATGSVAQTAFGPFTLERNATGAVRLAVRPEQIVLTPSDSHPDGVVIGREFRGHDQLYWVRTKSADLLALAGPNTMLDVGTAVRLTTSEPVALFDGAAV